jgi:protein gp37
MALGGEWWDISWNVVTGCDPVSAGCMNCYARRLAGHFRYLGQPRYRNGFRVTYHPEVLAEVDMGGSSKFIFVCSMSDLFHERITDEFRAKVFARMRTNSRHTFMLLTKRSGKMVEWVEKCKVTSWPQNVWAGVTVEDVSQLGRLDDLRLIPARVRFVSFEPLLSMIQSPDLSGLQWAIIGGETGPNARVMDAGWASELLDACLLQGLKVWFKGWGARGGSDPILDSGKWRQRPEPVGTQQGLF